MNGVVYDQMTILQFFVFVCFIFCCVRMCTLQIHAIFQMSFSKTRLDQRVYITPSTQCLQCIIYVEITRRHCFLFILFLICILMFWTCWLSSDAAKPLSPLLSPRLTLFNNISPNPTLGVFLVTTRNAIVPMKHVFNMNTYS